MKDMLSSWRARRIIAREVEPHVDSSVEKIMPMLQELHGSVLEIGPGAGNLLKQLPKQITYTGLEPNVYLHQALIKAIAARGMVSGTVVTGSAERLPFHDGSFDAVVSVRTLCSMKDLPRALVEIKRVLKPGGIFIFVEHVGDIHGSWRRGLQNIAKVGWRHWFGCNPAADIAPAIEATGFKESQITPFAVGGRRNVLVRTRIFGFARR